MKIPVLSTYLARFRFLAYLSVSLLTALTLAIGTGTAQNENQLAHTKKVLVLDPGHGGHDHGAGKPNDIYEKEVALIFSRLLAEKLKDYTVHLTRADDYQIDLMHRPAVANHLEADLFLSIHTGASTLHNPNGMLIAYYDNQFILPASDTTKTYGGSEKEHLLTPWNRKSFDHIEKSRYLAGLLKKKILKYDQGINVDTIGMPIVVLEGADLPALLIEIGYLTNPSDLQKLNSNAILNDYAEIIRTALDTYFSGLSDL